MKKILMATTAVALLATGAQAEDTKIGILLGFTGPLESLANDMAAGAELAIAEVNESGMFLDGATVSSERGDTGCIDAGLAVASAERLITSDRVSGIVGGMCSGETTASLQNVAIPNGIVMISPSATSPALSTVEDNGLFFRTSPSDARQGQVMADILNDRGITEVAVTYTNNDYGKGLADSFESAFKESGGTVTINTSHEDGKADYSAEVGALASAGGEVLIVAGYVDQGGAGIVNGALDAGAFDTFMFPDGMVSDTLEEKFAESADGSFGQNPSAAGEGPDNYKKMGEEAGFEPTNAFSPESYDAAALMLLAMQAAGSNDPAAYKEKVMEVANAPGEKILPGELGKALQIIKDGGDVDYVGASAVELIGPGESAGSYREIEMKDGKMVTIGYR
ncbi:MAG TPA: branched-chain amino acid ABC transporter substrate-binding protein [Sulfitobacter sp.]|uniref:Leu/Ile/Val-binding protein n=1 Tax=Sulfitobacter dubius TaxID=218673 RepID=A0ABY3ZL14_9RHOB|nr:ABC transporter substrate-binding protein [Sulfitobacter dubius]MBM05237.1 branched-chain amino acid ABC transporter substrate-binding protein [Sulfitobacter sp.]UOA14844.1 Leu/Ile/Val-binding protein [Sulfitobacter dubius]WOI29708.1 ABC transporter substrate-binding protein [Sulfitobacter dubius]SFG35246.1 amino acid/amide ABC transporter substrate-binding protein, HAAT family [Sulfitobacter dubius]HBB84210.1 branched-chain amino acid ABC transporter substrate-binding protein [Sulfitobacte